jgi:dUTP pyrophosphatase
LNIKPLHPNFTMPTRGTEHAGGYDLYMPEPGLLMPEVTYGQMVPLGFAAEVPVGYVALLLPRSGAGAKHGVSLNNTVGVIDSDYRGEWMGCLRLKNNRPYRWSAGDRLLQFILVPVHTPELIQVTELGSTLRGEGGFGSTNKV